MTTAGLSLAEELLFIRKSLSIVDFFSECSKLLKAFKLENATQQEGTMQYVFYGDSWSRTGRLNKIITVCCFVFVRICRFAKSSWNSQQERFCYTRSIEQQPQPSHSPVHLWHSYMPRPGTAFVLSNLPACLGRPPVSGHYHLLRQAGHDRGHLQTGSLKAALFFSVTSLL